MSTRTRQISERWLDEYADLLEAGTEQPSEGVRRQAASLGRLLFDEGVPPDDVAAAHMAAVQRFYERSAAEGCKALRAGRPLLAELMKVYGAAYQEQQELNRRLVGGAEAPERSVARLEESQRALQQSEEDFRALVENARDGILIGKADGRYVYANKRAAALTGYSVEELVTAVTIEQLIAPDELNKVKERCRTRLAGNMATEQYETAVVRKDGARVLVEVTAARTLWQNEPAVLGILRDITERKRAEETLRTNAARLRLMLDQMPAVVWTTDAELRFTSGLGTGLKRLGLEPNEVVGRSLFDFFRTEDPEYLPIAMHRRALQGKPSTYEDEWEGNVYQSHVEPLRDGDGRIVGVIGVALDITARKRAEDALREANTELEWRVEERTTDLQTANWELQAEIAERRRTEEALRRSEETTRVLLDASSAAGILIDAKGHILALNETCARGLGGSPEELVGQYVFDYFPPEVARVRKARTIEVVRTGKPLRFEDEHRGRIFDSHVHPVFDSQGRVERVAVFGHNITEQRRAEEALRESEAKYRQLFETVSDALVVFDAETREFLEVNDAAVRLYGYSREEFLKLRHSDLTAEPEESDASIEETLAGALTRIPLRYHRRKDATVFPVEISASAFTLAGRRVLCGVIRDITERRAAEDALRRSEETARVLLNASTNVVILMDTQGHVLALNEMAARKLGGSQEELLGRRVFDLLPPDLARLREARAAEVIRSRRALRFEDTHRGTLFDNRVHPIFGPDGDVERVAVFASDVTERRRAEEARRESEEKLAGIVGAVTDHMSMIDREHNIVWANDVATRLFGPDLVGRKCYSAYHGRDEACEACVVSKVFADGQIHEHETEVVRADGKKMAFWCTASVAARREDGRPKLVVEVSRDITGRKRAEQALREQREILENVLAHVPHSVFWKNRDSVYLGCNQNFVRDTGLASPQDVVGKTDYDLPCTKEQADSYRRCDQEVISGGVPLQYIEEPYLRPDGIEATLLTSKTPLHDLNGRVIGVLGIYADITERKQAEEALRRQALVFENIYDGVIVVDTEERISDWNPGAERMFGYSKAAMLGKSPEVLNPPGEGPNVTRSIRQELAANGRWCGQVRFVRADGSEGVCEVVSVPLCDASGRVMGRVSVNRDITDRIRAEEEAKRRQEELAHVSRLGTMGEMATGLAHELNQPLSAILYYARGCARRLRAGGCDFDEVLGVIEKMAVQAERAGAVLGPLRAFVRKRRPRLAPVDINLLVREAVDFVEHEARENHVRVDLQLSAPLRPVLADMIQVEQVILNLVRNGIEAMQGTEPGKRRLALQTSNAGSDAVTCAVRDTGCGFPEKTAKQLFDAFYTTKPDGMGMGLPISRSIIESHGGRLWAAPSSSGGATFRFTLPVCREG